MKLGEIAKLQTGLVLNRKQDDNGINYKLLSAKYIDEFGKITDNESFCGVKIQENYFTKLDDIIMKIATPNLAIYISSEKDTKLLVPSYFFIIRCQNTNEFIPEFLSIYFNSNVFRQIVERESICSTVKAIKLAFLQKVELPCLTIKQQEEIIEFSNLASREKQQIIESMALKEQYNSLILSEMLGGKNRG